MKQCVKWGKKESLSGRLVGSRCLLGSLEGGKSLNSDGFGLLTLQQTAHCTKQNLYLNKRDFFVSTWCGGGPI